MTWPPPFPLAFDAVEVLAGYTAFNAPGDRRFDDSVRDFYTLVDHGHLVAPLGNSDTHDLNWVLDGTDAQLRLRRRSAHAAVRRGRLHRRDPRAPRRRDQRAVARRRGRRDAGRDADRRAGRERDRRRAAARVWVDVTVSQARFVHVDRIRITIGGPAGPRCETIDVPAGVRTFHWAGAIEVGTADTWIGVTADGDTPLPLEQTGTYQQDKWNRAGVTPFAIASADPRRRRWRWPLEARRRRSAAVKWLVLLAARAPAIRDTCATPIPRDAPDRGRAA